MPTEPAAQSTGLSRVLANPIFLIGGAGIVLLVLLKGGGGGSSGAVDNSGALSSQLAEDTTRTQAQLAAQTSAISDLQSKQQTQDQALAQETRDRQAAMVTNANDLQSTLGLQSVDYSSQVTNAIANQNSVLMQVLDALKAAAMVQPGAAAPGATPAGPAPSDSAIQSWAAGLRPDNPTLAYNWGKAIVARFGRLPSSIAELNDWLNQLGIPH